MAHDNVELSVPGFIIYRRERLDACDSDDVDDSVYAAEVLARRVKDTLYVGSLGGISYTWDASDGFSDVSGKPFILVDA
ncbi:hypothetical protein OR16_34218 [Cupriavidus basilensis OR16]|uniref:Uncharacterized protein n=1 Tax=Cupriavidus basilensis OR16 TaxID=1127483 RepID=H1SEV2_9BURK|nr:hypothetical protein OR16_34218 [Cupriavidus basilensis OR16]